MWFGTSGMHWEDLERKIESLLKVNAFPDVIIIHLGSNDLASIAKPITSFELIRNIECSVLRFRSLIPNIKLVWSDILPRRYWHGAKKPNKVDKARKRVNCSARTIFKREGGSVIQHPDIRFNEVALYRNDGIHLSDTGNSIFVNDLQVNIECL